MTHQISLPPPLTYNAAFEFTQKFQRFTAIGLTLASIVYCIILGSYWLSIYLQNSGIKPTLKYIDREINVSWQPPSIGWISEFMPSVSLATHASRGIPVPVPDAEVNPEQTIATQPEMANEGISTPGIIPSPAVEPIIDETPLEPWKRVEKNPILVKRVNPQYPELARITGLEGKVVANIWIDKEGKIRQVVIIKSDSDLFSRAVIDAVQQWIYTPAYMSKGPVAVWVNLPFNFILNK